ncbi:hypothetical protein FB451DRAFT_1497761 [Mycena latifolia]|nr:hypothetical protein FB451DRAFT_1497761 [Mycena latifolia]
MKGGPVFKRVPFDCRLNSGPGRTHFVWTTPARMNLQLTACAANAPLVSRTTGGSLHVAPRLPIDISLRYFIKNPRLPNLDPHTKALGNTKTSRKTRKVRTLRTTAPTSRKTPPTSRSPPPRTASTSPSFSAPENEDVFGAYPAYAALELLSAAAARADGGAGGGARTHVGAGCPTRTHTPPLTPPRPPRARSPTPTRPLPPLVVCVRVVIALALRVVVALARPRAQLPEELAVRGRVKVRARCAGGAAGRAEHGGGRGPRCQHGVGGCGGWAGGSGGGRSGDDGDERRGPRQSSFSTPSSSESEDSDDSDDGTDDYGEPSAGPPPPAGGDAGAGSNSDDARAAHPVRARHAPHDPARGAARAGGTARAVGRGEVGRRGAQPADDAAARGCGHTGPARSRAKHARGRAPGGGVDAAHAPALADAPGQRKQSAAVDNLTKKLQSMQSSQAERQRPLTINTAAAGTSVGAGPNTGRREQLLSPAPLSAT